MDWLAVGTFVAGLVSGYAIKFAFDIRSNKSTGNARAIAEGRSVAQSGNVAGGHITAGDIKIEHK